MTTENTDAGIRILTKAIRKLTAQLAEAEEQQGRAHRKRQDAESELMDARAKLDPDGAHTFPRYFFTLLAPTPPPRETVVQLAEKRMAELAELRQELANWSDSEMASRERVAVLEDRIEQALARLGDCPNDVSAILRGEA